MDAYDEMQKAQTRNNAPAPPCASCPDESKYGIEPEPATWVVDAYQTNDGDKELAWPLCESHSMMGMIAWGPIHRWDSDEGQRLLSGPTFGRPKEKDHA